jgi:hypothetical protein
LIERCGKNCHASRQQLTERRGFPTPEVPMIPSPRQTRAALDIAMWWGHPAPEGYPELAELAARAALRTAEHADACRQMAVRALALYLQLGAVPGPRPRGWALARELARLDLLFGCLAVLPPGTPWPTMVGVTVGAV